MVPRSAVTRPGWDEDRCLSPALLKLPLGQSTRVVSDTYEGTPGLLGTHSLPVSWAGIWWKFNSGKSQTLRCGKRRLGLTNSWNQEHKLLYDCPAATAVLCLLPHPPCADQLSPTRWKVGHLHFISVLSWSFRHSIMGGPPAPLGYFAGPAEVWFLPDWSPSPWSSVNGVCWGRGGSCQKEIVLGQCRVTLWPSHLWGLLGFSSSYLICLAVHDISSGGALGYLPTLRPHISSYSYFVLSLSF